MPQDAAPAVANNTVTFAFSHKTLWNHAVSVFSHPSPLITFAFAFFGGLWSIYEASVSSLNLEANRVVGYAWILGLSVISSGIARIYAYINICPDGLETLTSPARRIAHLQRPKWEFRFAKSVLAQLIAPTDREWKNLRNDNVYILATRPRDVRTYFQWLSSRTDNLFRMLTVAKKTMLFQLPNALTSTKDHRADPRQILESLQSIADLYRESVAFEKSSLAIIPPDEFLKAHKLQIGWSEPIRNAVHQLFELLQEICEVNPKADSNSRFTIKIDETPNTEEYCLELDRLQDILPQIMENEW